MSTISRIAQTLCLCLLPAMPLTAQNNGGGNGGNNQQNTGGIIINGEGVVQTTPQRRISPAQLKKLQQQFTASYLSEELIESSPARVLSLKQLDQAVKEALDSGKPLPEPLKYLAGIQRIDVVRIDQANHDILIIGPAEGFGPDPSGQIVGASTGRPPMKLDDLVVALRATFAGETDLGVSIDPTPENLANLQNYVRTNTGVTSTANAQQRLRNMARILGNQVISLWGVPEESHFALALVEADLRMKRIALGLDPSGVRRVTSHLTLLRPQGNSLQRWWFMPYYEPIATNADRTMFEIKGQRAQLMAQEEISDVKGERTNSAFTRQTTEKFAENFTEHFEELAAQNVAFAELQNLYDHALLAALAKQNWPFPNRATGLDTLLNDERLPVNSFVVPKFVPSASTNKLAGGVLLGLVGGVTIDVDDIARKPEPKLQGPVDKFDAKDQSNQWWWIPKGD